MSRRKPSLRIGGGVLNRSTLHNPSKQTGLGLLGSYDDIDESTTEEVPEKNTAKSSSNVDSKVADFLKEIDELETENSKSGDSPAINWGSWQQCLDEKTQHPYYWNTSTNEVTWILPEEIAQQLNESQSVPAGAAKDSDKEEKVVKVSSDETEKVKHEKEPPSEKSKTQRVRSPVTLDIDVEAELDQALESVADAPVEIPELDADLELLRMGKLPLSQHEEDSFLESLEEKILALEENEENRRKNGSWKEYKKIIELRHEEVRCDKLKWRMDRLPKLKKFMLENNVKEPSCEKKDSDNIKDSKIIEEGAKVMSQNDSGSDMETSLEEKEDTKPVTNAKKAEEDNTTLKENSNSQSDVTNQETKDVGDLQNTKAMINSLSTELLDKLNFLDVSMNMVTHLQRLLIEIQTRIADWKAEALSSDHLLKKLSEAAKHMKHYENNATPDNWFCHWDSSAKRYFYENKETKTVQWEYPEIARNFGQAYGVKTDGKGKKENDDTDLNENKSKKKRKVEEIKDTETKRSRSLSPSASSAKRDCDADAIHSNFMSEKVLQTKENISFPGHNFTPFSGFPQNYGTYANYHMMMRQMMCPPNGTPPLPSENASEAVPPPLPSEQPPPLPPSTPPLPPGDEIEGDGGEDANGSNDDDDGGIVMEMSEGEDEKDGQPAAIMSQNPVLYKPTATALSNNSTAITPIYSMSHMTTQSTNQTSLSRMELSTAPRTMKVIGKTGKNKAIKKSKKAATGKKPPKEMTSLVAQWQKAKQQIEEEDRLLEEDDEEEIDRTELNKMEIEKWKQDQILSGKAMNNSNFEPVPEDWRARILKKKKGKS